MNLKSRAWVVLGLIILFVIFWFVFQNEKLTDLIPGQAKTPVEQVLTAEGLNSQAFLTNALVDLNSTGSNVSLETLARVRQKFAQLATNAQNPIDVNLMNAFVQLTLFYEKKQNLKNGLSFFQTENTVTALCPRQADLSGLVSDQEGLYLDSVNLEAQANDLETRLGKKPFEMNPEGEFRVLDELRSEQHALELGCLLK